MPKLLNDLSYADPVNTFTGLPVAEIKALNEQSSQDYQQAHQAKNALDVLYNNLDVRDVDYQVKKNAIEGYKTKVTDLVNRGDYQNAKYLVQDLHKSFQTDNELQGALKSRQEEKTYYQNLKDQLDKGEIDKKRYTYAVTQSKLANAQKIQYDPETMQLKNSFTGTKIGKDLSDEIEKDSNDFIKDWKATQKSFTDSNGKKYEIKNIDGINKVFISGKEATQDDLSTSIKQHILNQNKYKDYLEEERNIDKFNMTYNPKTKQVEPFQRKHLEEYTNDELQKVYTGGTDKDIEKLLTPTKTIQGKSVKKSSQEILADKATANELLDRKKNFDVNNPKQLEEIYNSQHMKRKLNEMSYPSAQKASFEEDKFDLFKNEAALENLKHKHAKELKAMDMPNAPMITNYGTVQASGKDVDNLHNANIEAQKAVDLAKSNLDKAGGTNIYNARLREYNDAVSRLNISNTNVKDAYANISGEARDKVTNRISEFFTPKTGLAQTSNWESRPNDNQMQALISEAMKQKDYQTDYQTVGYLKMAQEKFKNNEFLDENTAKNLAGMISKNNDLLKIASDIDAERTQRSTTNFDYSSPSTYGSQLMGQVGGLVFHHPSAYSNIQNIIRNDYEDNQNTKNVKDIVTVPDAGEKLNTPLMNQYHQVARALLQTENALVTTDGSIDDILKGNFYKLNEKGVPIKTTVDPQKTLIGLAPGGADGQPKISITFKDEKGNDLSYGDGGRKTFFAHSENPEATKLLYKLGEQYAQTTGDENTFLKLKGEDVYASQLNDVRLGQDSDPITIRNDKGEAKSIKFEAATDKNGHPIEGTSYVIDAVTNKPLFADKNFPEGRPFRSKADLYSYLAKSE